MHARRALPASPQGGARILKCPSRSGDDTTTKEKQNGSLLQRFSRPAFFSGEFGRIGMGLGWRKKGLFFFPSSIFLCRFVKSCLVALKMFEGRGDRI